MPLLIVYLGIRFTVKKYLIFNDEIFRKLTVWFCSVDIMNAKRSSRSVVQHQNVGYETRSIFVQVMFNMFLHELEWPWQFSSAKILADQFPAASLLCASSHKFSVCSASLMTVNLDHIRTVHWATVGLDELVLSVCHHAILKIGGGYV